MDPEAVAKQILEENPVLYSKVERACRIPSSEVPVALREAIRFLILVAESKGALTPSQTVDEVWHEFILCTRAYTDFCQAHFGRYVHHHPGGEPEVHAGQFRQTLREYRARFGLPPLRYWDSRFRVDAPTARCGSCESP
jgi:hypothetical protein